MDVELAAVHEAGHSVMQWFVGWLSRGLQMSVKESHVTNVHSDCPHPTLESTSAIRKRLLVLFAGQAATQHRWPESSNNRKDSEDALQALNAHLQLPSGVSWSPSDGMNLKGPEAHDLVQTTKSKCDEIVGHESIRNAIDTIGTSFAKITPDADGAVHLPGSEVVAICVAEIGDEFRQDNQWVSWIAGN